TRRERVRLALVDERTRVARDLHDVVAHGLTVMVVQAGAARALAAANPAKARDALVAVQGAGLTALRELTLLMRSLGSSPPGSEDLSSEDGSPSVRSLVDQAAGGGMDIDLRIDGPAEDDDPAAAL